MNTPARHGSFIFLMLFAMQPACNRGSDDSNPSHAGPDPIVLTVFTPTIELYLEYPQLIAGHPAKFLAHLSVLETGEPVRSGEFVIKATRGTKPPVEVRLSAPKREGLYTPEFTLPAPGEYVGQILIKGSQVTEEIPLGMLVVHANEQRMQDAAGDKESDEPVNAVPFLMEQQWKINMLLGHAVQRTMSERLQCVGEVAAPVDASAVVSAPVPGLLLAASNRRLPLLGETVEAGQTLAYVEPPSPVLTEVAVRALELQTRALDIEKAMANSRAKLEFATREVERLTKLLPHGAVPEKQLDEARRNQLLAEAERDAAQGMKTRYGEAAKQLTLLQTAASGPPDGVSGGSSFSIPLQAPIAGQITVAEHVTGEHIDAHEEVFRIINPTRVWIVTRVSEFDLARLPEEPDAIIVPQAFPERSVQVREAGGRLVHMGVVVQSDSRTVAIRYELPNPEKLFRVGMLVDAFVETKRTKDAIVIPEAAVVLENGRPIAFVLLEGELFQRRELETGIRDGGFIEVKAGVSVGERVATRGAHAIKLSSMSGASFGPGHVH